MSVRVCVGECRRACRSEHEYAQRKTSSLTGRTRGARAQGQYPNLDLVNVATSVISGAGMRPVIPIDHYTLRREKYTRKVELRRARVAEGKRQAAQEAAAITGGSAGAEEAVCLCVCSVYGHALHGERKGVCAPVKFIMSTDILRALTRILCKRPPTRSQPPPHTHTPPPHTRSRGSFHPSSQSAGPRFSS